jgi:hypothetical protein
MTTKSKGRISSATPKTTDSQNNTTFDPPIGSSYLVKASRNRQPKRKWTRGQR